MSAIAETSMTTGGMDGQTTYAGVEVPPIKLDSNYVSDGSNLGRCFHPLISCSSTNQTMHK